MSIERSLLVAVPRTAEASELIRDIVCAVERAQEADPGDRIDVVRYESLSVQLEALAYRALSDGADHFEPEEPLPDTPGYGFEDPLVAADPARLSLRLHGSAADVARDWASRAIVVELRMPFGNGVVEASFETRRAAEPSEAWEAEDDATGSRAVEQRFRAQLEALVTRPDGDEERSRDHAIAPSGVHNRVLTQVLREFVIGTAQTRLDAPVVYRDGSQASNLFALRCLPLESELPREIDLALHLALLSIRHTEMDPVVDGAWLRNAEVSRPRPAALTDDFVYETSMTQLAVLSDDGRLRLALHIYQTGLDTAVVGFYRAVVEHLLKHPYSLSVVPMFYASGAGSAGVSETARFRPGKPWTLGEPR